MTKVISQHGEYFPKGPIWLVFDLSNGDKDTKQYVWWFRRRKLAQEWIREHCKDPDHYNVSVPSRWSMDIKDGIDRP